MSQSAKGTPRRARQQGNYSRKPSATSGFGARKAAAEILHQVLREGAALDDAFTASIAGGSLKNEDGRDRALARLIVATSLRRLPEIELKIADLLSKPLGEKTGLVREILISGAAQIRFLDIAPHAVVNVATAIASGDRHGRHFKGLVNGVLRNLVRSETVTTSGDDAVRTNFPSWLLESWTTAYSEEDAMAAASLLFADPPLDLTVKSDPEGWATRLGGIGLANGTVRITKPGRVEALDGYKDGEWWVQDAAASMPARLAGASPGKSIVDLCAAPGGKSAQLAQAGAHVIAVDRDANRTDRLKANLARLALKAEIVVADANSWRPPAAVDAVLLDAPCSATGIFRRHPDMLRRRGPGEVAKLAKLQEKLIDSAAAMLPSGGTLVYCTCSLEPAEGEDQIAAALDRHEDLTLAPATPAEVPGFAASITSTGVLRILPHHLPAPEGTPGGSDGFFAARLQKS